MGQACLALVLLWLTALPGTASAGLFYKVEKAIKLTDLNPAANGSIPFSVTGLNDAGRMVGYFPSSNANKLHAFVWDNSSHTFLDLNTQLAADSSMATCLNEHGTVAGVFWELGTYAEKGFIYYPDGTVSTFAPPGGAGGDIVSVTAINELGDLTGSYADAASGLTRGYVVQQGASGGVIADLGDLGLLDCAQYTWPNALNKYGQIAGNAYLFPVTALGVSYTKGFFWDGSMTLIDVSDLSNNWTAISLDSEGNVLGLYGLREDRTTPFATVGSYFWDGQTDIDLGDLGGGSGANAFALLDGGLAFGTSLAADGQLHLFEAKKPTSLSGFTMMDWGSVNLYAGDESFLPMSLSAVAITLPKPIVAPDAVGAPSPPVPDFAYYIAGFGTDIDGNTRALLWNNHVIHNVIDLMPGYLSFTTISNAYGSRVLINGSRQIACAGTDVSGRQMALLLSIDPDTDNDGLPDRWEMRYYGHLGVGKDDLEIGGGGLTNWQAFQQGSDPNDFYNGHAPQLTIASGTPQSAAPGSFVPAPLVVQVTDAGGNPITNAPVTFSLASGDGQLQASRQASPKSKLSVTTDANGQAKAFFQVSATAGVTSGISAVPTGASPANPSVFLETADNNSPVNPTPTDPSSPPPAPQDVPVQSYASIDASGSKQDNNDVTMVALDDNNHLAFAFTTPDNQCKSYVWQNGTATLVQSFPLTGYGHFYEGNGDDIIYPGLVTSTGEVEGGFYGYWPTDNGGGYIDGTFYATGGNVTAPIGLDGDWTAESLGLAETANGRFGAFNYGNGGGCVNGLGPCGVLEWHGVDTVFVDQAVIDDATQYDQPIDPPGWHVAGVPDVDGNRNNWFNPFGLNAQGHAVGMVYSDLGSLGAFWDGTNLNPLYGEAVALNKQDQIVGYEQAADGSSSGYLWENGQKIVLVNHLPAELIDQNGKAKISNIQPKAISNQTGPATATAPATNVTIYILATANVTQSDGRVVNAPIVCSRDNDGVWSFAQVGVPDGTNVTQYVFINSSGTLAFFFSNSSGAQTSSAMQPNDPMPSPTPTVGVGAGHPVNLAWVATTFNDGSSDVASSLHATNFFLGATVAKSDTQTLKLNIEQDIQATYAITYTDGSYAYFQTKLVRGSNAEGFVPDTPPPGLTDPIFPAATNPTCIFFDSPGFPVPPEQRPYVSKVELDGVLIDYVKLSVDDKEEKPATKVKWSFSVESDFDPKNGALPTDPLIPTNEQLSSNPIAITGMLDAEPTKQKYKPIKGQSNTPDTEISTRTPSFHDYANDHRFWIVVPSGNNLARRFYPSAQ